MQVNRRDADYHDEQPERMTDADRLAAAILQVAYSGSRAQTPASQGLIQMDCVAVYMHGSEFIAASNAVGLTMEMVLRAWSILGGRETRGMTVTIADGPRGMHAEMKIVSYFIENHWDMQGLSLGVSKPCCPDCLAELHTRGIACSTTHTTANRGVWIAPG